MQVTAASRSGWCYICRMHTQGTAAHLMMAPQIDRSPVRLRRVADLAAGDVAYLAGRWWLLLDVAAYDGRVEVHASRGDVAGWMPVPAGDVIVRAAA